MTSGLPTRRPVVQVANLGSLAARPGLPCIAVRAGIRGDADREVLSRRRLRGSAVGAKPAEEHAGGVGLRPAGVACCVHESLVGGSSVQFVDVLLGDDGGEVW